MTHGLFRNCLFNFYLLMYFPIVSAIDLKLDSISLENRENLPGSSPSGSRVIRRWGWSRRLWKNTYLITDIERLEMDSVVGRLVEKKRLNNLDFVE